MKVPCQVRCWFRKKRKKQTDPTNPSKCVQYTPTSLPPFSQICMCSIRSLLSCGRLVPSAYNRMIHMMITAPGACHSRADAKEFWPRNAILLQCNPRNCLPSGLTTSEVLPSRSRALPRLAGCSYALVQRSHSSRGQQHIRSGGVDGQAIHGHGVTVCRVPVSLTNATSKSEPQRHRHPKMIL